MKAVKKVLKWFSIALAVVLVVGIATFKLMPYQESKHDARFYFPRETWAVEGDIQAEEVTIRSKDNMKLVGLMLKPAGRAKATVFMLHGAGGNAAVYTKLAQPLVQHGYQVFIADWRGFGKSDKGILTHTNILKDSQAALDHVLTREDVKGTKVILWGLSLGGQVAVKLARENEDKLDALVTEGAVLSHYTVATDHSPAFMKPFLWAIIKAPYTAEEDIQHITKLPKLIIQSHDDTDVPFGRGQELFEKAAEPKAFWAINGEHLDGTAKYSQEYAENLDQLIAVGTAKATALHKQRQEKQ